MSTERKRFEEEKRKAVFKGEGGCSLFTYTFFFKKRALSLTALGSVGSFAILGMVPRNSTKSKEQITIFGC